MRSQFFIRIFLCAILLGQTPSAFAFETDQYNLPPKPLADIGDEVTKYTEQNIREAFEKINVEIALREECLEQVAEKTKCKSAKKEREQLKYLRSEDAIAKAVFKNIGDGIIPFTKAGSWMEEHRFKAQPARYKTGFQESIFLTAPFNYLTISSTVNLYGTQFGTDKIAHIFQQGYDYYAIRKRALAKGLTEKEAIEKAVDFGKETEKTYFGTWVSAIYSNADLAANYAGIKFYEGLTSEVKIGDKIRPAVLILKNGIWEFNENADIQEILLKPFVSKHLNEAYNPGKIFNILGFRSYIRRVVHKRACKQWFEREPDLSQADLEATTKSLELWYGEDYGFSFSKNFVTIANTCFDDKEKVVKDSNKKRN